MGGRLGVVLIAAQLGGCGGSAANDAAPASCTESREEFEAFVAAHRQCDTAADCSVVGFVRDDCECAEEYFTAVNINALSEAEAYLPRLRSCVSTTCDAWDEPELTCDRGQCVFDRVIVGDCFGPFVPDAAPRDAAQPDAGANDA
jgi:hypothetical protein